MAELDYMLLLVLEDIPYSAPALASPFGNPVFWR